MGEGPERGTCSPTSSTIRLILFLSQVQGERFKTSQDKPEESLLANRSPGHTRDPPGFHFMADQAAWERKEDSSLLLFIVFQIFIIL